MNPVDDYISKQPGDIRLILNKVRELVLRNAPAAEELISYGMPAYKLNGKPLVYFAAQKGHLGFYATPSGHEKFSEQLSGYKHGKGSVQFPYSEPVPYDLIEEMVKYRVWKSLSH